MKIKQQGPDGTVKVVDVELVPFATGSADWSCLMKIKQQGPDGTVKVVDVELVPFATLQENFNLYQPDVENDHPLFGRTIKLKFVVKQICFVGVDELGNPNVSVSGDAVVGME